METDGSVEKVLSDHDVKSMSEEELVQIIKNVLEENEKLVNDYKAGNERVIKAIMGLIMKETRGNANPKDVTDNLKKLLD